MISKQKGNKFNHSPSIVAHTVAWNTLEDTSDKDIPNAGDNPSKEGADSTVADKPKARAYWAQDPSR